MQTRLTVFNPLLLEACSKMYFDAFTAEPVNYHWLDLASVHRYLSDITFAPRFLGFVFWVDQRAVGFVFGEVDDYFTGRMYEIKELAVAADMHGAGVGRQMLEHVSERLSSMDIEAITLHTSRSIPAYEFYLKNGFDELDEAVTLFRRLM